MKVTLLLQKLLLQDLSSLEQRSLIDQCSRIALAILATKYKNSQFPNRDLSAEDLASDAIIPLFLKTNPEDSIAIRKSLQNWNEPIDSDESAYFFLSRIIGNRIEQEISKKLKEADPFFGKILRSINYTIEKNNYAKATYFGVVHIIENSNGHITQKPPSAEFIEALPNNLFHGTNEKIIASVLNYLKSETDFFPAIPLNALIRRIKKYYSDEFSDYSSASEANLEDVINVQRVVNSGLEDAVNRLDQMYVSKGKLSKEEADNFKKALYDYVRDLSDGGVSRGLYQYLNQHMLTLSKKDFYEKYHQNFDYLIRLLKKSIAEKLQE